jgi:nicotinate-nucleotide pyrophosphorylase (carboxylating)
MMTLPSPVFSAYSPGSTSGLNAYSVIQAALMEDLALGDVTTDNLSELTGLNGKTHIVVRQSCIVSGLGIAQQVIALVDPSLKLVLMTNDGQWVDAGQTIATISGSMASILKIERTMLNFLQHLSGIASLTHQYVLQTAGTATRITHTRKTTPGLRALEQQAVLHGGGAAHRFNLSSAVMLKDNHLQALATRHQNPIAHAVKQLREKIAHTTKIEVEVDTLEQVHQAIAAQCDIILLDNMTPEMVGQALVLIGDSAITEASGCITLELVNAYAKTGVNLISTSKITLGVPAIDIGLDFEQTTTA